MSSPIKPRQTAEPTPTPEEEISVIQPREPETEVLPSPPRRTVVQLHGPHFSMPPLSNAERVQRHLPAFRILSEVHSRRVHYETIIRDQRRRPLQRHLRLRRDRLLLFRDLHARLRFLEEEMIEHFRYRWGLRVIVARSEEELQGARRRADRREARQREQEEQDEREYLEAMMFLHRLEQG